MYRIWTEAYVNGVLTGAAVSAKEYKRKGNAERVARKDFSEPRYMDGKEITYAWVVAEDNPWRREN